MHAADENGVGPGEFGVVGRADVLVDQPHLPLRRQIGGDEQMPCGGMKARTPSISWIGMLKRAEGRRIARKNAKDAPAMADANRLFMRGDDLS